MADGESVFASVIAFAPHVGNALLALEDGASVSLSGELKVGTYTGKDGATKPNLSLTAHELLTPYHVQRRRKAVTATESKSGAPAQGEDFNDPIPF